MESGGSRGQRFSRMKLLIDMNLSPDWCSYLSQHGIDSVHWVSVGNPRAPDTELFAWAKANGCVIFTHDLDFGALLAAGGIGSPSVLQIRTHSVLPTDIGSLVVSAVQTYADVLKQGAIVVVDEGRMRARILPFK